MDASRNHDHQLRSQALHLQHQQEVERQQQQIEALFRRQSQPGLAIPPSRTMDHQAYFPGNMYAQSPHFLPQQGPERQQLSQLYPHWAGPAPDESYLRHILTIASSQQQQQAQDLNAASANASMQAQTSYPSQAVLDASASVPLASTDGKMTQDLSLSAQGSHSTGSPHSLHDFVLGVHAFPTPPESDNSLEGNDAARSWEAQREDLPFFSFDAEAEIGATIDPSSMSFDPRIIFGEGYSDTLHSATCSTPGLSPSTHSNLGLSSATSHGGSPPHSNGGLDTSYISPEQLSNTTHTQHKHLAAQVPLNPAINNAMGMLGVVGSVPSMFGGLGQTKKRQASDEDPTGDRPVKNLRTTATSSKEDTKGPSRRLKQEQQPIAPARPTAKEGRDVPSSSAVKLPGMEAGSNATAQAAILKLRQRQAAAAAAAAGAVNSTGRDDAVGQGARDAKGRRGRHASSYDSEDDSQDLPFGSSEKSQRKVAHNAIERRYRNNINDRIAALRHAVPALHDPKPLPGGRRGKKARLQNDLVDGVPRATKLNKATILGTATAYIRVLKGREIRLSNEVVGLRQLITSLEGGDELLELWEAEMQQITSADSNDSPPEADMDELDVDGDSDDDEDEEEDEDEDADATGAKTTKKGRSSRAGPLARAMTGASLTLAIFGPDAQANQPASASVPHFVKRSVFEDTEATSHSAAPAVLDTFRILTFFGIFLILFWPVISRLLIRYRRKALRARRTPSTPPAASVEDASFETRRRALFQVLARSHPDAREINMALRAFVAAPVHPLCSSYGLILESAKVLRAAIGLRPSAVDMTPGDAAIWLRLLEVETSLGPLAEPSLLARLYTIARVSAALELNHITRAQGHATLALALLRAMPGNAAMERWALQCWERARRCRLIAADEQASQAALDHNSTTEARGTVDTIDERWLDAVLKYETWEALAHVPAPTAVLSTFKPTTPATTRATALSPLLSVAVHLHASEAHYLWASILEALARHTCPGASNVDLEATAAATVRNFVRHARSMRLELDIATSDVLREAMSSRIAQLVASAPPVAESRDLAQTLLGAWSLMIGNMALARQTCASLMHSGAADRLASAAALVELVLPSSSHLRGNHVRRTSAMVDCAENVAAATLRWLLFLRGFAKMCSETNAPPSEAARAALVTSANQLRAQLAVLVTSRPAHLAQPSYVSARRPSATSLASDSGTVTPISRSQTPIAEQQHRHNIDLYEARDALTDVLATLTRRIVSKNLHGWADEDDEDSGVEWI